MGAGRGQERHGTSILNLQSDPSIPAGMAVERKWQGAASVKHRVAAVIQMAGHKFLWAPLFCVVTAQFPKSGHSQAELKWLIALKAGDLGEWESGKDFFPLSHGRMQSTERDKGEEKAGRKRQRRQDRSQ